MCGFVMFSGMWGISQLIQIKSGIICINADLHTFT